MQREFVWTADQICELFNSIMRRYPISAFLFWRVPSNGHDCVEAYQFLHAVSASGNRLQLARAHGSQQTTFVLDGQQRLTSLLVGLQGSYLDKQAIKGRVYQQTLTRNFTLTSSMTVGRPTPMAISFTNFASWTMPQSWPRATTGSKSVEYWMWIPKLASMGLYERYIQAISDVRGALGLPRMPTP